jgi:hypothetical protein
MSDISHIVREIEKEISLTTEHLSKLNNLVYHYRALINSDIEERKNGH